MFRFRSHLLIFAVFIPILFIDSSFAVDLVSSTATIPDTYFGLHIHHLDRPTPTPWPSVPVPEWRLWDADVTWPDIEPAQGQWRFERLDRYVSIAQQHGTSVLLPLAGSPPWASARPKLSSNYTPGFSAEPASMEDWRTYVRTVAMRYKGRIHAYEIWNEPNLREFWTGTIDQMVALTTEAAEIVHSIDPQAIVVSPSVTANYGIPWFEEFMQKGGGQNVDAIGYHFYVDPQTLLPEDMVPVIQRVRKIMAANNLGNLPLWNTETGWFPPAKIESDEVAAGFLARAFTLSWAAGVQRFYWYAWDNGAAAVVTYKEKEHTITPAGHAYEVIQRWLIGAQMAGCSQGIDGMWICQLNRAGKKNWIVWNPHGIRKFDVPQAWQVEGATPLLEARQTLKASNIDIGPVPVLLEGHLRVDPPKQ
ncbi:MAG TPA: glycosyl hydrolase [Candidatus Acidoferrales bacterium]|nr:glycosyl hydrolase [Candidatus Acidoferrales bacterium]